MLKTSSLTVRVKPETRDRLDRFAHVTRRSKFFVIEEALEQYLAVNERQIAGIQDTLEAADSAAADFVEHADVLNRWEA